MQRLPALAAQHHSISFSADDSQLFVIGDDPVTKINLLIGTTKILSTAIPAAPVHVVLSARSGKLVIHSQRHVYVQPLHEDTESYSFQLFVNGERGWVMRTHN